MFFWLLILIILAAVMIAVLRPLFIQRNTAYGDEDRLRISIYQENLHEIDDEYARGQLESSQLENVRHELELALLQETTEEEKTAVVANPPGSVNNRLTAAALGVFIIAASFWLYYLIGNPQVNVLKEFSEAVGRSNGGEIPPLQEMLAALDRHLQKNPRDSNGWLLLANAYSSTGEFDKSVVAYERLYQLSGDQPQILLGYVNALVRSNNGRFTELAFALLQRVLKLEPDNYTALFFSGLAAEERGEYRLANTYYQKILPILQNDPELLQTVNNLIDRNQQFIAGTDDTEDSGAGKVAGNDPAASVIVRVSVAEDLREKIGPADTLFIYAQSTGGGAMPLAVVRRQAGELPVEVVLDDSMAMMPAMKLSGFEQVRLQARISKSGNAEPQPGDFSGQVSGIEVADPEPVNLVIDTVLP